MKKYQVLQIITDVNMQFPTISPMYETNDIEDARHKMHELYKLFIEENVEKNEDIEEEYFADYYGFKLHQHKNKCMVQYVLEQPIEYWCVTFAMVESGSILVFEDTYDKSYTEFDVVEGDMNEIAKKYTDDEEEMVYEGAKRINIGIPQKSGYVSLYKC